ncbi:MAG: hypothetical protein EAZ35_02145 [Sphingobacteriia bacterium]|nr:MAG: hypothetical protein EAZ35_02145 [Sphingobacteriia bacterium]
MLLDALRFNDEEITIASVNNLLTVLNSKVNNATLNAVLPLVLVGGSQIIIPAKSFIKFIVVDTNGVAVNFACGTQHNTSDIIATEDINQYGVYGVNRYEIFETTYYFSGISTNTIITIHR